MTDPDWEPIMKKAAAIVTNRGGRTCHAAIIARELGIPAVVGCGDATERMKDGEKVTVSCAEGDTGYVYADMLDFSVKSSSVETMPDLPLKVMMNVGNPDRAFDFACLPNEGVGLARLEFIINRMIGVHPRALLEFDDQTPELQNEIRAMMKGFDSPREFYVGRLTEGIATLVRRFIQNASSCVCRTLSPTNMPTWSAVSVMNRMKRTRCWASVGRAVMLPIASATALRWNATQ